MPSNWCLCFTWRTVHVGPARQHQPQPTHLEQLLEAMAGDLVSSPLGHQHLRDGPADGGEVRGGEVEGHHARLEEAAELEDASKARRGDVGLAPSARRLM